MKKLGEECCELAIASLKHNGHIKHDGLPNPCHRYELENIAEEMADVLIMISQIANHLQLWPEIHNWHKLKVKMLEERIKEED